VYVYPTEPAPWFYGAEEPAKRNRRRGTRRELAWAKVPCHRHPATWCYCCWMLGERRYFAIDDGVNTFLNARVNVSTAVGQRTLASGFECITTICNHFACGSLTCEGKRKTIPPFSPNKQPNSPTTGGIEINQWIVPVALCSNRSDFTGDIGESELVAIPGCFLSRLRRTCGF